MISKTSIKIINALNELAILPDEQMGSASEIAQKINAPANYLSKTLQKLARAGLLVSQKGFNGGFRLAKAPSQVSIYEVIEQLEDVVRWEGCFMGKKSCSSTDSCAVHDQWLKIRSTYVDFLKTTMLSDLSRK